MVRKKTDGHESTERWGVVKNSKFWAVGSLWGIAGILLAVKGIVPREYALSVAHLSVGIGLVSSALAIVTDLKY